MKKTYQLVIFLVINFGALWLSRVLMNNGPTSDWYLSLDRAPWTPPNWAFGVAWSVIMVCFAVFMAHLTKKQWRDYGYYAVILALCVEWNYAYFNQHQIVIGMIILVSLVVAVVGFTWHCHSRQQSYSWLMLPFVIWSLLATTLNAYQLL